MFVNQRLQIDIGQNVAAVGQEMLAAEIAFCIFDAAAGLQQLRFVNKRHRTAGIVAPTKKSQRFLVFDRNDKKNGQRYSVAGDFTLNNTMKWFRSVRYLK